MAGLAEYFRSWIAKYRSRSEPQDGLIGTLIQAQDSGQLSEEELLANCILMWFAGDSSTKHLIGNSIFTLLTHPLQLHLLQADSSLIEMAISEVLRYETTFSSVSRTAMSDIKLSNQTIHEGQAVHCIIAAANRDPAQFLEPDKFDIRRQPNPYLSFSRGIHTCIGKHLANMKSEKICYKSADGQHHPMGNGHRTDIYM